MIEEEYLLANKNLKLKLIEASSNNDTIIVTGPPLSGKSTAIDVCLVDDGIHRIDNLSKFESPISSKMRTIYIKLPSQFESEEDLYKWYLNMEKFLKVRHDQSVVIEGRKYIVRCVLDKVGPIKIDLDKSAGAAVLEHTLESLKNWFKSRGNPDQRLAGIKTYVYSLTKDDAEMLVTRQFEPNDPQSNLFVKDLVEYAKVNVDEFKGAYLAPLIFDGVQRVKEKGSSLAGLRQIGQYEKVFYPKSVLAASASAAAQQAFQDKIKDQIDKIAAASASTLASSAFGVAGMFIVPFIFGLFNKGDRPQAILLNTCKAWQSLTEYKKELVAYYYDEKLLLVPGDTKKILDGLFGKTKDEYETKFKEFKQKLENLDSKIQYQLEHVITDINKIYEEIEGIKQRLMQRDGVLVEPMQLGLIFEGEWKILGTITGEKEDVRLVTSGPYYSLVNKIRTAIESKKIVIVTGLKGVGKSLLARYALALDMIDYNRAVIDIKIAAENEYTLRDIEQDIIKTGWQATFFFDPLTPYMFGSTVLKTGPDIFYKPITVDPRILLNEIKRMNAVGVPAVLVLPNDLYYKEKSELVYSSKLEEIEVKELTDTGFLEEVILAYCGDIRPNMQELQKLARGVANFNEGHTLIAANIGIWLSRSSGSRKSGDGQISDISKALVESVGNAKMFFKYYISFLILEHNRHDNYKAFVLPLLVHVYLGEMSETLAEELPSKTELMHLDSHAAKWIAHRKADLMEETLKELAESVMNDGKQDSVANEVNDMLITFRKSAIKVIERGQREKSLNTILDYVINYINDKLKTKLGSDCFDYLIRLYIRSLTDLSARTLAKETEMRCQCMYNLLFLDNELPRASRIILTGTEISPLPWRLKDKIGDDYCDTIRSEQDKKKMDYLDPLEGLGYACIIAWKNDNKCLDLALQFLNHAINLIPRICTHVWYPIGSPILTSSKKILHSLFVHKTTLAEEHLRNATKLISEGKFAESLNYADKALEIDPDLTLPYFMKSQALFKMKEINKAKHELQSAIKLNPDSYVANIWMSQIERKIGNEIKVAEQYNNAMNTYTGKILDHQARCLYDITTFPDVPEDPSINDTLLQFRSRVPILTKEAQVFIAGACASWAARQTAYGLQDANRLKVYNNLLTMSVQFVTDLCKDADDPYCLLARTVLLPRVTEAELARPFSRAIVIEVLRKLDQGLEMLDRLRGIDPWKLRCWLEILYPGRDLNLSFKSMLEQFEYRIRYQKSSSFDLIYNWNQAEDEMLRCRDLTHSVIDHIWIDSHLLRLKLLMGRGNKEIISKYEKLWKETKQNVLRLHDSQVTTILAEYAVTLAVWNGRMPEDEEFKKYSYLFWSNNDDAVKYVCVYAILCLVGLADMDIFSRIIQEYTIRTCDPLFRPAFKFALAKIEMNQAEKECEFLNENIKNKCYELVKAVSLNQLNEFLCQEVETDLIKILQPIDTTDSGEILQTLCLVEKGERDVERKFRDVLCAILYNCVAGRKVIVRKLVKYGMNFTNDFIRGALSEIANLPNEYLGNWSSDHFRNPILQLFFYIF
jgi:tetratricopeptide (TPR) repeat protein